MADATFFHGEALMVDHTPSSAVDAGDVIVVGDIPFVAHSDIAANVKGAVAASGGVYKGISDGTLDSGGDVVYWDAGNSKFSGTAASSTHFGYTLPDQGATDDGDEIYIIHAPNRAPTGA